MYAAGQTYVFFTLLRVRPRYTAGQTYLLKYLDMWKTSAQIACAGQTLILVRVRPYGICRSDLDIARVKPKCFAGQT